MGTPTDLHETYFGQARPLPRTDVQVCMPWRPSPTRIPPYDRVRRFWEYAGFSVVTADSDPALPFNRAQARNNAVRAGQAAGAEVVIVADADTVPSLHAVHEALDGLTGMVYCGDPYNCVTLDWVHEPDLLAAPLIHSSHTWAGGVWAIHADLYWQLGGQDERFANGWGGEDEAFYFVAETLSTVRRVPGPMYAFDHDGGDHQRVLHPDNEAVYNEYKVARRRAWVMREVLKRR